MDLVSQPIDEIPILEEPDPEADERYEFQVEDDVNNFVDEQSIPHNEYPESDDDGDAFRKDIKRGDGKLNDNQKFVNGVAFKEAVLDYALRTGRNIQQSRWDKTKLEYRCLGEGCSWRIYCAITRDSPMWRVRIYHKTHTCVPNGECSMIKVPVIARLFVDKIREEPSYFLPMKMTEIMKERWKISVSRPQCQAARNKALGWINREYSEQFARLRDYAAELELTNEGTTVKIDTIKNDAGEDVFNRFYVCFQVLRNTWKDSCRRLIGVDGSFLRSTTKGQLLIALGRDANNAIYPVAWAVVRVENTDNWLWFVECIKTDLELGDGENYILVSDRCKGIIKAALLALPNIEHRHCVRHIYGNLKKIHGKKPWMKPCIWNLAWSYNYPDYRQNLERIKETDEGVYNDLLKTKPESWCRAFYKLGNFCEDVENNSVESFNSSIVKAREKPFMPMLETIRKMAMVRIAERSVKAYSHEGLCTPYVAKFFAAEHEKAALCIVNRSTNGWWESSLHDEPFRVNLERRHCSCMKWDICGIPCEHAYGVILKKNLQPDEYVCNWFSTDMWRKNYTNGLLPIRGIRFWPVTDAPIVHEVPASSDDEGDTQNKKVNKPDKKRKKPEHESPTKNNQARPKTRRIMHCGICGEANHNSRFHKDGGASKDALEPPPAKAKDKASEAPPPAKPKDKASEAPPPPKTKAKAAEAPPPAKAKAKVAEAPPPPKAKAKAAEAPPPAKAKDKANRVDSSQTSQTSQVESSQTSKKPKSPNSKIVWKKGSLRTVKKEPKSPYKKKKAAPAVDHLSFHCLDPKSNL